ncbi:MAG: histidine kinase [Verrucomicrobiota bacterium]|jgi:signal transduction histidine kinase
MKLNDFFAVYQGIGHVQKVKLMRPTPNLGSFGTVCLLACILAIVGTRNAEAGADDASPVATLGQVRTMTPGQADKSFPAHLRGVVTFSDWNADRAMFIQDPTAGLYIGLTTPGDLPVGEEVEVDGTTVGGDFVPYVRARQIRRLGLKPLPEPHRVSYEQLAGGREDSQWVEVRGVVRSVIESTMNRARMDLLVDGERLSALVSGLDVTNAQRLVCATVRVRGVCRTRFNLKRQMRAPYLSVSGSADIVVALPAPGNPVEVPMASLLRFNSAGYYGRRVAVRGVVTEQKGESLFLQDKGATLYVKSQQGTPVVPGDIVEVIGFPMLGQYAPVLEDAVYQIVGRQNPPEPVEVEINQLLTEHYDLVLVRLQGRLLNRVDRYDEEVLVLESENMILSAHLDTLKTDSRITQLENGSELELTGVCLAQPVANWNPSLPSHPEAFQLLLRSAGDVVVLQYPSWWTLSRLCWVLGMLTVALLAGFAWVFVLDRRVRQQTHIIQRKIQHEAVLEERTRIAREFHDTLEQELAAITIQLDTVAAQFTEAPAVARQLLELARTMSRRSLSEARRSVWDLRSHLLENSNLLNALSEVAKFTAAGAHVRIDVQTSGQPRKLPATVENNLLRIAQEALANALKHASASQIVLKLIYEPSQVLLRICDDGAGFDTACHAGVDGGHFGLLDMSERAGKIGGTLSMISAPGQGTEIVAAVTDRPPGPAAGGAPHDNQREKVSAA